MVMASALGVLVDDSARAYSELHRAWSDRVSLEARVLAGRAPDLLLSNVSYVSLEAGAQVGIPSVALCSLNWADIYGHYCGSRPEAANILATMRRAYDRARYFVQPEPSMPMASLPRRFPVGPIARKGCHRRPDIDRALGLARDQRLVLVALGGVRLRPPMECWPGMDGVRWLVQADWQVQRDDVTALESLGLPFEDVLASCDLLVTKPGYGAFAEAACNGIRVLYVSRPGWPEQPYLESWLHQRGRCAVIRPQQLEQGAFADELYALLELPPPMGFDPVGATQAADLLERLLR